MIHVIILKQFWQQQEIIEVCFFSKWFKNTSESANCLFYFYLIYTQSHIAFEHFKFANWFFFTQTISGHSMKYTCLIIEQKKCMQVLYFFLSCFCLFPFNFERKTEVIFFAYNFYLISMGSYRNVAFWLVENDGLINISRRYQVM